jgi:hypothetical protein
MAEDENAWLTVISIVVFGPEFDSENNLIRMRAMWATEE